MATDEKQIHIRCTVKRTIFFAADTGYSVFAAIREDNGKEMIVTGNSFAVAEGILLDVEGCWKKHDKYGQQFAAVSWMEVRPETLLGIEKYLASGKIKGIGKKFAHVIVERFGHSTFEIIENFPDRLAEIPRFGIERARRASRFLKQQSLERDVTVFLSSFGISNVFVKKIIKEFGYSAVTAVRQNPYCLVESIDGISFKSADKIAKAMGFADDDPRRLQAGVVFVMSQLVQQGDCYIQNDQLLQSAVDILNADSEKVDYAIRSNFKSGKLVDDYGKVYLKNYYDAECYCAKSIIFMLHARALWEEDKTSLAGLAITEIESLKNMEFDQIQKNAVRESLRSRVMILTGGPGTGKTTVLEAILCAMRLAGMSVAVCAPTGRAAKRAKESTHYDAMTIHRLLSFSWESGGFKYTEGNPLEEDVVVVDEFSMVDVLLFESLLKALTPYKRLILVGDVDQLPSVGAGNVLKDLIDSQVIPVVRLSIIHRQRETSRIPYVAQDIRNGRMPVLDNRGSKDFFYIANDNEQSVSDEIISLVADRLPKAYHIKYTDIQVLCPQRSRSLCGCAMLNKNLQACLNPKGIALQYGETFFRCGDIVMQMKNNYDKDVFNGDVGIIKMVDDDLGFLCVQYPDKSSLVKYEEEDLDELSLSYATTIHKSQGSEYNTVIIPILNSSYMMLQRNLIYTAVTRAKERCILIGDRKAIYATITNLYVKNRRLFVDRQTYLKQRVQQYMKSR